MTDILPQPIYAAFAIGEYVNFYQYYRETREIVPLHQPTVGQGYHIQRECQTVQDLNYIKKTLPDERG
jgi:hypothetical protein